MKKNYLFFLFCFCAVSLFSQNKTTPTWKELENFHEIVGPVFHSAEKGNFHAAKDSASLVLDRAVKWQAAPIPASLNSDVFKPLLSRLVAECTAMNKAVLDKKPDAELKAVLRKAHNTFHEILSKYEKSSN